MSASMVSITANTASTSRRRPVVAGEKKKSVEPVSGGVLVSPHADSNGVIGGDDKVATGTNKDLSHSIRGEMVLERPKDAVQPKKSILISSTSVPRRPRKGSATKPEKPRWQTVLSVFTKNILLLLVLVGLVQLLRRMVIGSRGELSSSLTGFSDMEGRIADVESYLKKTTQMMQVQVEAVDKKLTQEVDILREEVHSTMEDKSHNIAEGLTRLEKKNEDLEKALRGLGSTNLLTKENFAEFYSEFRKSRGGDVGGYDLSMDEIMAVAKQIVEKEIDKHAGDGLGRVDYALSSGGAAVIKHSEPFVVGKGSKWFSIPNQQGVHSDAEKMLQPSFGEPGQCFPLRGSYGFVQIRLRTAIIPDSVTLEHVSESVAYDRSSAPKDCRVSGWLQGKQGVRQGLVTSDIADEGEKMLLTEFTYDLEKSNAQTFDVFDTASSSVVDTIRFDFTSNHGSPSHTCIYRLRVHGREPNSLSVLAY